VYKGCYSDTSEEKQKSRIIALKKKSDWSKRRIASEKKTEKG
jgi:hypothetical protein